LTTAAGFATGANYVVRVTANLDGKTLADLAVFNAGEAAVNVTMQQGVAVAAADANGNVPANIRAVKSNLAAADGLGALSEWYDAESYVPVLGQEIRDAMKLAPTAGAPAAGSIDDKIDNVTVAIDGQDIADALLLAPSAGAAEPGSVYATLSGALKTTGDSWHEVETLPGALVEIYEGNAIDAVTGALVAAVTSDLFGVYPKITSFNDEIFVGISHEPASGTSAVIAKLNSDMTLTFDRWLPEEGVASMVVSPDGEYLIVMGVDERLPQNKSWIYIRDKAGAWTDVEILTDGGFGLHAVDGLFVGNRLYVCGYMTGHIRWTDDLGVSWSGATTLPEEPTRVTRLASVGDSLLVGVWVEPENRVWRSVDDGATWDILYSFALPDAIGRGTPHIGTRGISLVNWRDVVVLPIYPNTLLTIDADGATSEYITPFNLPYNLWVWNGAESVDEWLWVLGAEGVWRSKDMRQWERVWQVQSDNPFDSGNTDYDRLINLSIVGDNLYVATRGTSTQIFRRPVDPVVAQQHQQSDALLLAPSAGAAADGSVYKHLDDILLDTGTTLPAAIAVIDSNVDLLLAVDTSTTDATAAGAISRRRGNSWAIPLTIGAITGYTSLWFTIKSSYDDADTSALVQVKLNSPSALDGLLYVNGATASSAALGGITVSDATTGAIVVNVDETITDDLAPGTYYYDVQTLIAGAVATPDSGVFTVTADVTRSVA